jgi:hypothetical protein
MILSLAGCSMNNYQEVSCRPPTSDDVTQDLGYNDVTRGYVLAFLAEIDDRPLYVESALVVLELRNHKWRMVHVFRHSKQEQEHWQIMFVFDAYCAGSRDFDRPPTKAETEKFIRDSWWHSRPDHGFRLVRSDEFPAEWKTLFGYVPRIPRDENS